MDIITLLIALYGAILSTYKVVFDYLRESRRLKVEVSYGFLSWGNNVGPEMLVISAINNGFKDITLNSVGFILPDKTRVHITEPQSNVKFPYTISGGNNCIVWKPQKQFAIELKKNGYSGKIRLRGYYQSATGKIYKSKPIDFDIESALAKSE